MGRAVSTPSDTLWSVSLEYETDCTYHACTRCGHEHYTDSAPKQCEECGLTSTDACTPFLPPQYDVHLGAWYWDEFINKITETLSNAFPSLEPYTGSASDREHLPYSVVRNNEYSLLLMNRHVVIGVSEYCGVVAVWCVPLSDATYQFNEDGLHEVWAKRIEKRAERLLKPLSHDWADWKKAA